MTMKLLVCLICNFCIFANCSLSFKIYNIIIYVTVYCVMRLMFDHVLISYEIIK